MLLPTPGGCCVIRNFLRNFMIGRYGPDHLNVAMIIVSLTLTLLYWILKLALIMYISYAILALSIFRMLSRNIIRRRAENDRFIRYWWPIKTRASRAYANIKHGKTHRFLKCPSCGNTLRVPKGKGKLQITCPKCGERFTKKT
jgi:uncharacterized C2H2 Zn-finger protein